jgi:hypothetical protein
MLFEQQLLRIVQLRMLSLVVLVPGILPGSRAYGETHIVSFRAPRYQSPEVAALFGAFPSTSTLRMPQVVTRRARTRSLVRDHWTVEFESGGTDDRNLHAAQTTPVRHIRETNM